MEGRKQGVEFGGVLGLQIIRRGRLRLQGVYFRNGAMHWKTLWSHLSTPG